MKNWNKTLITEVKRILIASGNHMYVDGIEKFSYSVDESRLPRVFDLRLNEIFENTGDCVDEDDLQENIIEVANRFSSCFAGYHICHMSDCKEFSQMVGSDALFSTGMRAQIIAQIESEVKKLPKKNKAEVTNKNLLINESVVSIFLVKYAEESTKIFLFFAIIWNNRQSQENFLFLAEDLAIIMKDIVLRIRINLKLPV